jgi:hypothetical protein
MSDPISIIGIVITVGGIARDIVSSLVSYFDAVRDAPKQSQELRHEMCSISNLLNSLHTALMSVGTGNTVSIVTLASVSESISQLQSLLREMEARVAKPKTVGISRLKWPFSERENTGFISKIERYKANLLMALSIKGGSDMNVKSQLIRRTDISAVLRDVEKDKRRKILNWLSTGSNTRHEELKKCTVKNSGQWFLGTEEYKGWVDGTKPSCLLCHGIRDPF